MSALFRQSMLGLKYPIIQAPMAGVSTIKLAATITNHGGLGSLPLAGVDLRKKAGVEDVKKQLDTFKSLLTSPELNRNVNLNFFCQDRKIQQFPPTEQQVDNWRSIFSKAFDADVSEVKLDNSNISFQEIEHTYKPVNHDLLEFLVEYKPKVVSFHFGIPSARTIEKLKSSGIEIFVSVTSLEEAKLAIQDGVTGLVLQGYEAGGHRGNFLENSDLDENLSTYSLTQRVLREFGDLQKDKKVLIIAAGGIVSGEDINTYLLLGVNGVQLGTAFLDTAETNSNGFISKNKHLPTIMTLLISGKTARALRTPFIEKVTLVAQSHMPLDLPPYGYTYTGYKTALKLESDPSKGFFLAGQGYREIIGNGVEAAVVFDALVKESNL